MNNLSNNVNTFRILFLVKGILTILFSLLPLAYALFGVFIGSWDEFSPVKNELPFNPGIIFVIIGGMGFVFLMTLGILTLLASKYLNEYKNYTFIFVIAILNCFTGVLGILLGVFTIIELNKPHIRELFEKEKVAV